MDKFRLHITSQFNDEFDKMYNYIKFSLHSPRAADKFYFKIKKSILSLNHFPERFPVLSNNFYLKNNIRKMVVYKFIIIYEVQNNSKEVFILHIFHGSRDYLNKL